MKILILGYGNPGRQDDGLGPALIKALEDKGVDAGDGVNNVTLDSDYQLNIEYALDLAKNDVVIFVDASVTAGEPFEFTEIGPSEEVSFTTHSMSAESLLGLTSDLMETPLKAYQLAIRGYSFEFEEGLTAEARNNLTDAVNFIIIFISKPTD